MSTRVRLGSVSSGTHRPEDLIPAFNDALREITGGCPLVTETDEYIESDDFAGGHFRDACEVMDDLDRHLSEYAPPFCYFGAHDGDGADFGFWVSHDSVDEARRDGELASGDELPEKAEEGDLFLHVSDHGNMELFVRHGGDWESVWSVV